MKLWTSQPVAFYEELMEKGINYCKHESWWPKIDKLGKYLVAYRWMAEQMRERMGEPPLPEIKCRYRLGISTLARSKESQPCHPKTKHMRG